MGVLSWIRKRKMVRRSRHNIAYLEFREESASLHGYRCFAYISLSRQLAIDNHHGSGLTLRRGDGENLCALERTSLLRNRLGFVAFWSIRQSSVGFAVFSHGSPGSRSND